jgi:predicted nucleic acid-binding protein
MILGYADTGFIASLYLEETTSVEAEALLAAHGAPLPLTPFILLELRNAFNLAVQQQRITESGRDAIWKLFESNINTGAFIHVPTDPIDVHVLARKLSDRHTSLLGSRTLDLLHVATAMTLGVNEFLTFDRRQHAVARREGLKMRPARLG